MPISYPDALTTIGWKIIRTKPKRIVDIGCGCGLYGLLSRQYTDIDQRRLHKEEWTVRIDAIEVFPVYVNQVHSQVYNTVLVGDALDVLPSVEPYDLAICADVLEHFSFEDGTRLLELIREKANSGILSTPAKWIPQKGVFGNDHETHRHLWTEGQLAQWGTVSKVGGTLILEM